MEPAAQHPSLMRYQWSPLPTNNFRVKCEPASNPHVDLLPKCVKYPDNQPGLVIMLPKTRARRLPRPRATGRPLSSYFASEQLAENLTILAHPPHTPSQNSSPPV